MNTERENIATELERICIGLKHNDNDTVLIGAGETAIGAVGALLAKVCDMTDEKRIAQLEKQLHYAHDQLKTAWVEKMDVELDFLALKKAHKLSLMSDK